MELNITREQVCINDICFNQNVEHGVDFDVNIPDYCGEVHKILRTSLIPRISSKNVNGQTLTVDGNVCFNVVFLDDGNHIRCFEETVSFSKSIDMGETYQFCNLVANAKCGYLNAKAVNQHRVSVHSVIDIHIKGYVRKTAEIISDIDNPDVYVNRGDTPTTIPVACVEKNIIVEEELSLAATQHPIGLILRYNVVPKILSHKTINDKIIAKGELCVDVLYLTADDCGTEKYSATVPFSQIIDIDGVTEECECDIKAAMSHLELKPRNTYDGEARSFILSAKVCLCASAVCNNDVAVIYDAYSSKYNLNLKNTNTTFQKVVAKISDNYTCKKQLEFSDGDISSILDIWCSCDFKGSRCEENNILISGTVIVSMFAKNKDDDINYFEKPVDFEYKCQMEHIPENFRIEPILSCGAINYSVSDNDCVDVSVLLSVSAVVYEVKQINVITDAQLSDGETCKPKGECSLVIYYALKGESVWDIAKKYNASPAELMNINSLSETVDCDKTILISC